MIRRWLRKQKARIMRRLSRTPEYGPAGVITIKVLGYRPPTNSPHDHGQVGFRINWTTTAGRVVMTKTEEVHVEDSLQLPWIWNNVREVPQ